MPEQIRCPSCNAALRVPETLLGKNVKCPKCHKTFLAEMEERDEPEGIVREPAPSAARRRPKLPEDTEDEEEEFPPQEELEEEEERPRRRRRRRRRYAEAESAVTGPAISLMIIGSLDIVLVILDLILGMVGVALIPAGGRGAGGAGANFDFLTKSAFQIPSHLLGLCFAATILTGGIKMKQLQSYGLAMTASILAMLPCGNCLCCIGLPLGIWALVVLNKPEVKDAFS